MRASDVSSLSRLFLQWSWLWPPAANEENPDLEDFCMIRTHFRLCITSAGVGTAGLPAKLRGQSRAAARWFQRQGRLQSGGFYGRLCLVQVTRPTRRAGSLFTPDCEFKSRRHHCCISKKVVSSSQGTGLTHHGESLVYCLSCQPGQLM